MSEVVEDLSAPKTKEVIAQVKSCHTTAQPPHTAPSLNSRVPMVGGNNVNMKATVTTSSSKYSQLLAVIEDMGRDIRPTYAGSKSSVERIKRHIVHARILVRECLMECERAARS